MLSQKGERSSQLTLPISTRFDEIKGKETWRENIRLSYLVHSRIKSALGPKGAYKMVTYNRGPEQVVKISKDIIPMLDELGYQYPAVRIICEAAKMQRREDGDGVTQFSLLLTALLIEADKLLAMGVHPNIILKGFSEATRRAVEVIEALSKPADDDAQQRLIECIDCGRGVLTSRLHKMIVEASKTVIRNGRVDESRLTFMRKVGGRIDEMRFIRGVAVKSCKVHSGMPDSLEAPRLAVLSGALGSNRHSVKMKDEGPLEIELSIKDPAQLSGYRQADRVMKLAQIEHLVELGVNTLLCGQVIDDSVKGELARRGIYTLEKVEQESLVAVGKATGAKVVVGVNNLTEEDLGGADSLNVEWVAPERVTFIEGCDGATFLLRGSTQQAIDEIEQSIRNSLSALTLLGRDPRMVHGGGAVEMCLYEELCRQALRYPGREQIAIERYADALRTIPKTLAENLGYDPIDIISELSKLHLEDNSYGISTRGCTREVCSEPTIVKLDIYRRAMDVASLMLGINEIWTSKEIVRFHKQ